MLFYILSIKSNTVLATMFFPAFSKCGKENGLSIVFKCRKETELLQNCLVKWWNNEEFQEECKKQYLHERSEFRRTGIGKNQRTGH